MIESSLGIVHLSKLSDDILKRCKELGINGDELISSMHFADFHCIMSALVDEYGLETVLQEVTNMCEQLIKERTDNHE